MVNLGEYNDSLETSVPLYIANTCDSKCSICSMKNNNKSLVRKELSFEMQKEQLDIILNYEKVSSLQILTGEYRQGDYKFKMLQKIINLVNYAFSIGFKKINLNIGSLSFEEIEYIKSQIDSRYYGALCLSVFQETYDTKRYAEFFGKDDANIPKSKYRYRYDACRRWLESGFSCVNIGILFGVADPKNDIDGICKHFEELRSLGGNVEISVPRVQGMQRGIQKVSDSDFIDSIKMISQRCTDAKIIITTRENLEMIGKVLPYINIISPGTSDVGGYTKEGYINNNPATSQFFVELKRQRPSWVLDSIMRLYGIKNIRYYKE